jgi:hypothetical protein
MNSFSLLNEVIFPGAIIIAQILAVLMAPGNIKSFNSEKLFMKLLLYLLFHLCN